MLKTAVTPSYLGIEPSTVCIFRHIAPLLE